LEVIQEFLLELAALDVNLSVADGKLLCNAPKGAMTPALRESIQQHKPALLRLLAKTGARLTPGMGDDDLPLSFSQERIWLLSHIDPDNHVAGNVQFAFRLSGELAVEALEQTLNAVIERHAVLRTRCQTLDNRPVQHILPSLRFSLPVHDLVGLNERDQATAINAAAERCLMQPFDLGSAPLLRAELLRTKVDAHVFLLATHLYVFDGWSTALLFRELSRLYAAFRAGEASPLPPLPPLAAQYADFAHWHRRWFEGAEAAKQRAYWLDTLRHAQLVTDLPLDRPRLPQAVHETACAEFTLPGFLADAVRELSREMGATLFISLLAAFQTLLHGYTRQDAIASGTIVSNRRLAETEHMIGSFANNILIASVFGTGITFRALLDQVKKSSREAYAHQDIPFERLLDGLNPSLRVHPLFRVMFVLHQHQSIEGDGLALAGLTLQKTPLPKPRSKYDLELIMVDRNGVLSGLFEYNAGIFERATIDGMIAHFFRLLKQVTANPDLPLAELPDLRKHGPGDHAATAARPINPVAPATETEAALAALWQTLLGIENIGMHERFGDLGGHSLLAVRLMAAIRDMFKTEMTPTGLFDFPTIAELARFIDNNKAVAR
jgi:acyl carrier protein